ncbi:hypothetical protein G6F22_005317 [Rhizopus arrhizus]|nr:hypothetical protein G6F22_005317 [Rhizopus arrhizus]
MYLVDRHYNFGFCFLFSTATLISTCHLLTTSTVHDWDYIVTAITFTLALIATTTPQPFHPRDLSHESYEAFEVKNGTVYRNDLPLSPEATASALSWAAFQWMNPLVVFGFHNQVTRDNLYALTFQHKAKTAYDDFINTAKYISRSKVLRRIYSANKKEIWLQFIFSMLATLISFLGPVFQQLFLGYFENPAGRPIRIAYLYVLGLFFVGVGKLLCNSIQLWVGRRWNVRTFIMLDTELFAKTLKRKGTSGKVDEEKSDKKKEEEGGKDEKDDEGKDDFSSVGKITNLMSVDAEQLAEMPSYIFMMYNAPIQIAVGVYYLYELLGFAAIVGLMVMIVSFPISGFMSKLYGKRYTSLSTARDKRNSLLNELFQGIRMVKYFTWENKWKQKVKDARSDEISKLLSLVAFEVMTSIIYFSVPILVTVVSFIWYTKVAGNELTASVAFVSISLFEMLRNPLSFIPESILSLTEANISLKRIVKYLEETDIDENVSNEPIEVPEGVAPETVLARVGFEESVFQWHFQQDTSTAVEPSTVSASSSATAALDSTPKPEATAFQLHVPRFNFPTGKLSLIIGSTGSGKSSFLHAILGEMDAVSGRVYLPSKAKLQVENYSTIDSEYPNLYLNKVAYVAQQPFLQHASIRDNILFGLPYDEVRYKKVLYQCALIKDLSILPDGDLTEIGEKGISLSGGQKQRVSLARAVYSYAKTVLLDDCLSAVDAHTSKHLLKECIMGDLLQGRTIILVTHHVRLCLPAARFLVKIEQGNIIGCDSIENLKENGQLLKLVGEELETDVEEETIEDTVDNKLSEMDIDLSSKGDVAKLIKEETSEKGHVKFKVYATYFAACGGWFFWSALFFGYVGARSLAFAENWWLKVWAAAYTPNTSNDTIQAFINNGAPFLSTKAPAIPQVFGTMSSIVQNQNVFKTWVYEEKEPVNVDYYIAVYSAIVASYILFDTLRSVLLYWGSIHGARKLFNNLTDRVVRAPMRFFDTTPVGRLLNRFGKDISVVDLQLARSASFLIECVTGIIASTVVMSAITPEFIITAILVGCLYFAIGLFYLRISRELKRLNSVSRSPIYSQFTESLVGVTTIRAYSVEDQFMVSVYKKIDAFVTPFYFLWMSNRWLYARIELVGTFVTLFAGIFLLMNIHRIDAGMAGISLFYARSFLEYIYWFIRQYTQVEMNLNSVERIQEYLEIEQEAPAIIEGHRPPAAWPTTGSIEVKELEVRYAPELDPVLHGISFSTRPHEKIGIVGRTGSGKSTMGLSFFRFLEASKGSIIIDGIDVATIGLEDLRSRLTIIPQDAVLFDGTIRSNLDPFDEHSDEAVWESLERAHLANPSDRTKHLPGSNDSSSNSVDVDEGFSSSITNLTQKVSEGGNNFSQGQRQLICLARALLRNSKVIIMDEATASVDFETDTKIQTTIREEFDNSTLLCIAHRLRTIIDYDRILVLDQGKIVEYDTPYNLLFNSTDTGVFKSMCEQSGEFDILIEMAKEAHNIKEIKEQSPDNHSKVF